MGIYVNPGNGSMLRAVSLQIYVDKTKLLKVLNKSIGTEKCYFAVSRARRFGKTMAAGMIDAYYSVGCASGELFAPYEIAKAPDYEKHLNQYNVVHFDVGSFFYSAKTPEEVVPAMLVELKWNRSAKAAIKQIKDRNYQGALSNYHGDILLVRINYTKKTGKYTCRIERI